MINTITIAREYGSGGSELDRPSFRHQENSRLKFYQPPKCLVQIALVLLALGKLWLIDEGFRPGDPVAAEAKTKFATGLSSLQNPESFPLAGSDPCV